LDSEWVNDVREKDFVCWFNGCGMSEELLCWMGKDWEERGCVRGGEWRDEKEKEQVVVVGGNEEGDNVGVDDDERERERMESRDEWREEGRERKTERLMKEQV
jgi:hypothetical protein